jgi:hypothetical protein
MNGPNSVQCYITLSWKGLPGINTLVYWAPLQVTKTMKCCEYGPWNHIHKPFIFFLTYEWVLQCYITLDYKGLPVTNTAAYWATL